MNPSPLDPFRHLSRAMFVLGVLVNMALACAANMLWGLIFSALVIVALVVGFMADALDDYPA